MVRGRTCIEVLGRLNPMASISSLRPFATPAPSAMPTAEAASPSRAASASRLRLTCRRVAPIARSSAISRDRWVTIIVKVFQMMNDPTNSAMPAKTPNRTLRNVKLGVDRVRGLPRHGRAGDGLGALRGDGVQALGERLVADAGRRADVDLVEDAGRAEHPLGGGRGEVCRRRAAEVLRAAVADGADHGEGLGRPTEEDLDVRAEGDVVLLRRAGVDGHLVRTDRRVPGAEVHVPAQADVGGQAVAHRRSAALGEDGLAVGVGQQRVATDGSLGGRHAVDAADGVEGRGCDRCAGQGGARGLVVRGLLPDDRVGARGDLAEELVESQLHGVGEDEGAGQERHSEGDRGGGEDEAQLVREHPADGCGEHGGQAPRRFM